MKKLAAKDVIRCSVVRNMLWWTRMVFEERQFYYFCSSVFPDLHTFLLTAIEQTQSHFCSVSCTLLSVHLVFQISISLQFNLLQDFIFIFNKMIVNVNVFYKGDRVRHRNDGHFNLLLEKIKWCRLDFYNLPL